MMDDLGSALSSDRPVCMLGGGNPAHIPELEDIFSSELRRVLDSEPEYRRMLANYPSPAGEERRCLWRRIALPVVNWLPACAWPAR